MKIAIIGGGLAGCALAYALKEAGEEPVVYEAGPALGSGASGNSLGLYNPRISALRGPESDYYSSGFSLALQAFKNLQDIEWNPCGSLHLMHDEKKEKRFAQTVKNWGWDEEQMRLVDRVQASEIAGVDIQYDALYLPNAGSVSPKKLCEAYARDVDFHLNAPVENLETIDADVIVLACGPAAAKFAPELPLSEVRGQITEVSASARSAQLQCAVCYSGYISPARDGVQIVGSTFKREFDHADVLEVEDQENLDKLAEIVPGLETGLGIVSSRASVRVTSKDYFPVAGHVRDNIYISAAHGSHGILSALMAGHLLTDMMLERPSCLPADTMQALSPARFF